jgi:hypothetical protein
MEQTILSCPRYAAASTRVILGCSLLRYFYKPETCLSVPYQYRLDRCRCEFMRCLLHFPCRICLDQVIERVTPFLPSFNRPRYEILRVAIALVAADIATAANHELVYVV